MGVLTILIASLSLTAPADDGVASNRVVDMQGTASVRIVRAFRLERDAMDRPVEGASRRTSSITDRDGERRPIDLVEFE